MPYFSLAGIGVCATLPIKDTGIGTVAALMLPYSLVFLGSWCLLLVLWGLRQLPLGPGASFTLPTGP